MGEVGISFEEAWQAHFAYLNFDEEDYERMIMFCLNELGGMDIGDSDMMRILKASFAYMPQDAGDPVQFELIEKGLEILQEGIESDEEVAREGME